MSDPADAADLKLQQDMEWACTARECRPYTYYIKGHGYGVIDARNVSHCIEQLDDDPKVPNLDAFVIKLPVEHLESGAALYRGDLSLIEELDAEIAKAAKKAAAKAKRAQAAARKRTLTKA